MESPKFRAWPEKLVTSVRLETIAGHDHLSVFVREVFAGTLTVPAGLGEKLRTLLLIEHSRWGDGMTDASLEAWLELETRVRVAETDLEGLRRSLVRLDRRASSASEGTLFTAEESAQAIEGYERVKRMGEGG